MQKALLCTFAAVSSAGYAQVSNNYPTTTIKIIVPLTPGGAVDTLARAVAQGLSKRLGQPVIVDNRPGAGGTIGVTAATKAAPDGYTLLLGSNGPISINPSLYKNLAYLPSRDLIAVGGIATIPFLLAANTQFPANNLKELIDFAKAKPGSIAYASSGTGTTSHLVGASIESSAGIKMVHVPYKGAAPAVADVAGGQVQIITGDLNTLVPMIKSGRLKPIAITGSTRSPLLPQVPTVAESGFANLQAMGWFGLFAPKGVPDSITSRLRKELNEVLKDDVVIHKTQDLGGTTLVDSPRDRFQQMVNEETTKWAKIITDQKISAD